MKELTDIVWPEISKLAQEEVQKAWKKGLLHSKTRIIDLFWHSCFYDTDWLATFVLDIKIIIPHHLLYAGCKVCILDAAVLLEAEWDRACHEVWVSVVPPKEVSEASRSVLRVVPPFWPPKSLMLWKVRDPSLPLQALKRIVERDHVLPEVAQRKLASQITNQERVDHAHVLLSTLWEPAETQRQVWGVVLCTWQ